MQCSVLNSALTRMFTSKWNPYQRATPSTDFEYFTRMDASTFAVANARSVWPLSPSPKTRLHLCQLERNSYMASDKSWNPQSGKTLLQRYQEKINKNGPIPPHMPHLGPCWPWTGYCDKPWGYGRINVGRYKDGKYSTYPDLAHRVGYELLVGPIPEGLCVCHRCDNPACQRPDHWFLDTSVGNANDRHKKNRDAHLQGEAHGAHKLTEEEVRFIRANYPYERIGKHDTTWHQYSCTSLAKMFNVSKATIHRVIREKTWARLKTSVDTPKPQA